MTEIDTDRIDMSGTLQLIDEIRAMLVEIDGRPLDIVDGDNNKVRQRWNATRSREMLYAAHLADCIRLDITSQYHRFKGHHPPELVVYDGD